MRTHEENIIALWRRGEQGRPMYVHLDNCVLRASVNPVKTFYTLCIDYGNAAYTVTVLP